MWVAGEVQRPRTTPSGHLYFELVEKGSRHEIIGRLEAVLFRRDLARARRRLRAAGEEIVEGQTLRCGGEVDLYPQAGRLQLVVREVDPLFTVGVLAQRRRETLAALAEAGDLDRNRRLALPTLPLRVGLVTSRDSAAYHDFLSTLRESGFAFVVRAAHASVQGAQAPGELVRALRALAALPAERAVDVVVLVRGGGARSDLHCFDDRELAETIARYKLPVLTGLGHEIDESIADRVAQCALKTPTKAAEHLVAQVQRSERALTELQRRLLSRAERPLSRASAGLQRAESSLRLCRLRLRASGERLAALARLLGRAARDGIDDARQSCRRLAQRFGDPPRRQLAAVLERQSVLEQRLAEELRRRLREAAGRLEAHARVCNELSPQRLLERGYSVTRTLDGRLVREAASIPPGTMVRTELASGRLSSRVEHSE